MSSNILMFGDCEKVDCVHILIVVKSHRTPSVKINVFGPIAKKMTLDLWTL